MKLPGRMPDEVSLAGLMRSAKALADPIRLRMLSLMAAGRSCCGELPAGLGPAEGICVCEFQRLGNLGQSKASYHLRILKEAGLVREEIRGKWSFYSLNKQAGREFLASLARQLGLTDTEVPRKK